VTFCAAEMICLCVPDGPICISRRKEVAIEGFDREELLVGWLSEINGLINADGRPCWHRF
jgi:hypothetical protein